MKPKKPEAPVYYDGQRVVVAGASGGGKTYWTKKTVAKLLKRRKAAGVATKLIVFDGGGDSPDAWYPVGATYVYTRKDFLAAAAAGKFPLVVKEPFRDWAPFGERGKFFDHVWVVDEAAEVMNTGEFGLLPSQIPIYTRSRHKRWDVLTASQQSNRINGQVWTNKTHAILLPPGYGPDRKSIESGMQSDLPRDDQWRLPPPDVLAKKSTARIPFFWPEDFAGGRVRPELLHRSEGGCRAPLCCCGGAATIELPAATDGARRVRREATKGAINDSERRAHGEAGGTKLEENALNGHDDPGRARVG